MPRKPAKPFGRHQAEDSIQGFERDVPPVHTRFTKVQRAELEKAAKASKITISEEVRRRCFPLAAR